MFQTSIRHRQYGTCHAIDSEAGLIHRNGVGGRHVFRRGPGYSIPLAILNFPCSPSPPEDNVFQGAGVFRRGDRLHRIRVSGFLRVFFAAMARLRSRRFLPSLARAEHRQQASQQVMGGGDEGDLFPLGILSHHPFKIVFEVMGTHQALPRRFA